MDCTILRAASLQYTNWGLKICIWQLYFSSWMPKGDLRKFLISSPDNVIVWREIRNTLLYNLLYIESVNPWSPNIQVQILQSDLRTFPLRISRENLMKDQGIFSLLIILLILITLSLENVWITLGEILCWSLLTRKRISATSQTWLAGVRSRLQCRLLVYQ